MHIYIYRPQRNWAKVMFLQASVILSTAGEGVCLSACWIPPPWSRDPPEQTPSGADTPCTRHPRSRPPGADTPRDQTPTPPGADSPPRSRHSPGADTPAGEADASIRSMSGRYASCWNAFLLSYYFKLRLM